MDKPTLEELIVDEEVAATTMKLPTSKKDIAERDVDAVAKKDSKGKGIAIEGVEIAARDASQSVDAVMDLETFIQNSFIDTFSDDFDVFLVEIFELNDLFFSKVDAIKSNFAYLCDVLPNSYAYCDDPFMHIFDINSMKITTFNLGTIENLKNIIIASDLSSDESEKMNRS